MVHDYNKRQFIHSFCFMENNRSQFFFIKLCFFNFCPFDFNVFNDKITETKHSHLSNGSQLTLHCEMSTFTRLLTLFLLDENFIFLSKYLQNCVSSTFSRLNLTYLVIKSQKQSNGICQIVHDKHRKLATFPHPLT